MTPFRISVNYYGSRGHGIAAESARFERIVPPEERFVHGNGPVRVYVENGKKLRTPKVLR